MKRREFMALLAASPFSFGFSAQAEAASGVTVGYISSRSAEADAPFLAAFLRGMNESGADGAKIEFRWADNQPSRVVAMAEDLVSLKPAVILAGGGSGTARVVKKLTSALPIVFVNGADPVRAGLVSSINRPDGNVTGVNFLATQIVAKRLELLLAMVPNATSVAVLANPGNPDSARMREDLETAEARFKLKVYGYQAADEAQIERAFAEMVEKKPAALLISGDTFFNGVRRKIIALCLRERLPAIFDLREFAIEGGLMSYGTSHTEAYRQGGIYVGKILSGAKPSDLPVMQSTRFELIINKNTARALNLQIPATLASVANEIVE